MKTTYSLIIYKQFEFILYVVIEIAYTTKFSSRHLINLFIQTRLM
jgi:hypothetical protein